MFGKRDINTNKTTSEEDLQKPIRPAREEKVNTILKGSKVTGDISVSSDLRLTGDVVGNITSEEDSNIVIQGMCNGNIRTRGGNVSIEGELISGDIIAGGEVQITGKFDGGNVKAKEKIYLNGEFNGKLESSEIEIGPNAKGEGEILYQEFISISKGADIEGYIKREREEFSASKKSPDMKVINMDLPLKESGESK